MTREQAITILSEKIKPCVLGEWGEATDMAIEALSADAVQTELPQYEEWKDAFDNLKVVKK